MTDLRNTLKFLKFSLYRKKGLFYPRFQDELYNFQQEYMRGNYTDIKKRQKVYLKYIKKIPKESLKSFPFLDAGFGRGEFLDMLKEKGIKNAIGVDINKKSVVQALKKGIKAVDGDINKYLYLQTESLSGISAFHIIEHMSFAQFFDFLILARDRLITKGVLIMETPNIENILVSSLTFYYDHTHQLKLPRLLIKSLLEFIGFRKIKFLYLHPAKNKNITKDDELLYGPQDLGVIAYK